MSYIGKELGEYGGISVMWLVGMGVGLIAIGASYMIVNQEKGRERVSTYECGFEPYEDARGKFDVRYYLVGIMFLIFDMEASFMYPWAITLGKIGGVGYWGMIDFLFELCVGYVYAWRVGALEW
uniref:NADH-ubiquinone oxidoreductase chain 3 n=1 Tax=Labyrinthula sp. TaxID=1678526 RepID=A0A7S6ZP78_9STRA|nr:NADH dehydrogenase subunit 3 [Labyrinthula sp.]